MKKRVIIIGARQHAKVICNILQTSKHRGEYEVVGFVDDNVQLQRTNLLDLPIVGRFSDLPDLINHIRIDAGIIGISNRHMQIRKKYFEDMKRLGLETVNAIHDFALVDDKAEIGSGIVLNPGCVVNAFATVGDNVVAYSNTTIEHEDVISDNVYFGPGVNLTSGVKVGPDTFIGAGVKIIPDITIGKSVTIGAGSVILRNVPDNSVVAGVPAKIIKSGE